MPNQIELQKIPDEELITLIKRDPDYFSVVYKKTKDYCLRFLYKMNAGSKVTEEELNDIYEDAVIVLYEKIIHEDFQLTNNASIQTYLNAVCRFKLLDRFKKVGETTIKEGGENWINDLQTDPSIEDKLREIKVQDEKEFDAIEKALQTIKKSGGNCYEILTLFWYHEKSNKEIAKLLGYTTADNVKNQKGRCQNRLRIIAHKELSTQ